MTDDRPPEYLTAQAIAAELGVHQQTVQSYFRDPDPDRRIPGRKIGRNWTTTRAAFDAWLAGRPNSPAALDLELQTPPPLETK